MSIGSLHVGAVGIEVPRIERIDVEDYMCPVLSMEDGGPLFQLRRDSLTWRDMGDELVVFDANSGGYLTLNASAKDLWRQIADGATEAELVGCLCARVRAHSTTCG